MQNSLKNLFISLLTISIIFVSGCSEETNVISETSEVETTSTFNIEGLWNIGGFYSESKLFDVNENDSFKNLFDNRGLNFYDGNQYIYLNHVFGNSGTYEIIEGSDPISYLLTRSKSFMYYTEDGKVKAKEVSSDATNDKYIVTFLDEDTISYTEYDETSGKANISDSPYLFVRQYKNSNYIAANKTKFDNGSNSNNSSESASTNNKTTKTITTGESNALEKAYSYLNYTAFSYSGLIKQLEYEGFSNNEATYAVDNCGADWNQQALYKAKNYLDYTAFSYSGLIEQLEYEGFKNSEATYGADNCGADWDAQAVKKAQEYLEYSNFSQSDLIDQLEYEGFTYAQASQAVSLVY